MQMNLGVGADHARRFRQFVDHVGGASARVRKRQIDYGPFGQRDLHLHERGANMGDQIVCSRNVHGRGQLQHRQSIQIDRLDLHRVIQVRFQRAADMTVEMNSASRKAGLHFQPGHRATGALAQQPHRLAVGHSPCAGRPGRYLCLSPRVVPGINRCAFDLGCICLAHSPPCWASHSGDSSVCVISAAPHSQIGTLIKASHLQLLPGSRLKCWCSTPFSLKGSKMKSPSSQS